MSTVRSVALVGALTVLVLAGCGANASDAGPELSPTAAEGKSVARTNGCASCHGSSGGGGVGPAFTGLFGAEVELDDGSTVTADEEYLRRSIQDPAADKVAGFSVNMPTNNLSDADVDKVVAYIIELAGEGAQTDAAFDLSATAAEGQSISRASGCASCHGSNGQGGLAGAFVGLLGSEIELEDGTIVVVDEAYIRIAISDPGAVMAAGTRLPMPANTLSDAEIDRVVAYIVELGQEDAS